MDLTEPACTFRRYGAALIPIRNQRPEHGLRLHRILVRAPCHSGHRLHLGTWHTHSLLLTQYVWQDRTTLLHFSTSQLRRLISRARMAPHCALSKWATQLGKPVLSNVWSLTWMEFRSAAENTFLWQPLYRIPATQRWHFQDRPNSDPKTWCTRCSLNVPEDLFHCIWDCNNSRRC